ncbi:MAG TPA: glycosyltransferase family 4 protein [Candidatus Binatus sp.]|nr:glycosyltransferase family 4 protein [Candidatus Binatus sp.]
MKIALAHKRLDHLGGTERDLYKTAEGLRDLGHEVHLFCSEFAVPPPPGTQSHMVSVIPLGRTARMLSFAARAPRLIAQTDCDVTVSFGRMIDQDVLRSGGGTHRGFLQRLGEKGGVRRRLWQHFSFYHRSLLALEKRQFEAGRIKKIIAVSDEVKRDIIAQYAVNPNQITVLYNGVDAQRFHPSRRPDFNRRVRERWKIPLDAPLVVFVGSGFRRKGLDRLMTLWNQPRCASLSLLVVGHDARLASYKAWAESMAPMKIVFTGRQDEIESFYGAADIVALPALQEAFGNVVLEALASGVPVLVSRDVGASTLLSGRLSCGILERPDDLEYVATKLLELLASAKDPQLRQEARAIGEAHSWERHFQILETLLFEARRRPTAARVS